jgi:hypothetical protein
MSIALSNAIPPPLPQPTVLPAQVQVAQGATVGVPPIAVTAGDKGGGANETKNDTDNKSDQGSQGRGKLVNIQA